MKSTSVLVRFPGYSLSATSLLPDPVLASVAGALLNGGHDTRILDYGTLEWAARVYPVSARHAARRLACGAYEVSGAAGFTSIAEAWQIRQMHKTFVAQRAFAIAQAATGLVSLGGLDFVGLCLSAPADLPAGEELIRSLRAQRLAAPIVVFGPLVEAYAGVAQRLGPMVSACCTAQAEQTLTGLADWIDRPEKWRSLAGLWCEGLRAGAADRMGAVPFYEHGDPAYEPDVYAALEGAGKLRLFTVEDSRTSLHAPVSSGGPPPVTLKPAAQLGEELAHLATLYNVGAVHFSGTGAPASHILGVARETEARQLGIRYGRRMDIRFPNPEVFPALYETGCRVLAFDVATGSQRLHDDCFRSGAGITTIEGLLRASREAHLTTLAELVYPTPMDDYHTREETLRLLDRTRPQIATVALPGQDLGRALRGDTKAAAHGRSFPVLDEGFFPLPLGHWARPAERIGEWSPSQAAQRAGALREAIARRGVRVGIGPALALCNELAARDGGDVPFSIRLDEALLSGDFDEAQELLARFNACAVGATATRYTPLVSLKQAVGG